MFRLLGKKIVKNLRTKYFLHWSYEHNIHTGHKRTPENRQFRTFSFYCRKITILAGNMAQALNLSHITFSFIEMNNSKYWHQLSVWFIHLFLSTNLFAILLEVLYLYSIS